MQKAHLKVNSCLLKGEENHRGYFQMKIWKVQSRKKDTRCKNSVGGERVCEMKKKALKIEAKESQKIR